MQGFLHEAEFLVRLVIIGFSWYDVTHKPRVWRRWYGTGMAAGEIAGAHHGSVEG